MKSARTSPLTVSLLILACVLATRFPLHGATLDLTEIVHDASSLPDAQRDKALFNGLTAEFAKEPEPGETLEFELSEKLPEVVALSLAPHFVKTENYPAAARALEFVAVYASMLSPAPYTDERLLDLPIVFAQSHVLRTYGNERHFVQRFFEIQKVSDDALSRLPTDLSAAATALDLTRSAQERLTDGLAYAKHGKDPVLAAYILHRLPRLLTEARLETMKTPDPRFQLALDDIKQIPVTCPALPAIYEEAQELRSQDRERAMEILKLGALECRMRSGEILQELLSPEEFAKVLTTLQVQGLPRWIAGSLQSLQEIDARPRLPPSP